jgi:transposase
VSEAPYAYYVGVDWASEAHRVYLLDAAGQRLGERSVEHTGPGLSTLVDWLLTVSRAEPAGIAVAIEVPRGAVVETLLERGFPVFAINPKQLDRFRDRHTVAGAKDDRRDAWVLADALRTDPRAFRPLMPDDPRIIRVRELSRVADELQQEARRLANRVRDQLLRFYPQLLRLCPAADEPWFWALLSQAPTPAQGQRLPRRAVERLLRTYRIRRLTAEAVLAEVQAPALRVSPGTVDAATTHIALLLPRLRLVSEQQTQVARQIEGVLTELASAEEEAEGPAREHRDVEILRSLPGLGRLIAAALLGEAAQPLATRDYHTLRAVTGLAPVTLQSGKRWRVAMRYACHGRLRQAVYHWARVSVQCDPQSRAHYAALRARGHNHPRALRGVADRLLAVLIAMLKTDSLYDPTRRHGPYAAVAA